MWVDMAIDINSKDLINFYNSLYNMSEVNVNNERFRYLLNSKYSNDIVKISTPQKIIQFFGDSVSYRLSNYNGMCYCIPFISYTSNDIVGIYFRSVEDNPKLHFDLLPKGVHSFYLFGLYHREYWRDFKYNIPIVVVEGMMNVFAISKFYPYVVANLGSEVTDKKSRILSYLTSFVYIFFDNDTAGDAGSLKSIDNLNRYGVRSISIKENFKYNDSFESCEKGDSLYLQNYLTQNIKEFNSYMN